MGTMRRTNTLAAFLLFALLVLAFTTLVSADIPAPKLKKCEQTKANVVTVSWESQSRVKLYQVQFRLAGGEWRTLKVKETSIPVSGLKEGKTYQFRVCSMIKKNRRNIYSRYSSVEEVEIVDESLLVQMKGYTIKAGKTDVYENASLQKKAGTISGDEEVTIKEMTGKYAKIVYPVSGGTKTGYVKTAEILSKMNGRKCKTNKKADLYIRPNGKKCDSIAKGTALIRYGEQDGFVQVRYKSGKEFKLGFINKQDI